MKYFEVKLRTEIDGKFKTSSYVVKTELIEEVPTVIAGSEEVEGIDYTITSIVESKYINNFTADSTGYFWKIGLVWETPDGKDIKELYLVEGENMNLVRDKLIEELDDTSIDNFESHTITKIIAVI